MSEGFNGRQHKFRGRAAQFEVMISFMEQHGDISTCNSYDRLENLDNWSKLTELLNSKKYGYPKPVNKWRKCWSDLKNNTKRKLGRIKRGEVKVGLSQLEKRLLRVLKNEIYVNRKPRDSVDIDPIEVKKEIDAESDRTSSPPPTSRAFISEAEKKVTCSRKSSVTSNSSSSSGSESTPLKKRKNMENSVNDITEKYAEFEREREKMFHEREMARIRQNDQLYSIFGRIVTVLETLAPSIQRYLDRNSNIIEE